ncbi:AMP-binding protein [Streptomyces sp. SAI-124]|uniref:AMP-binding protein n=1 Tax=Streptomyces sp. SAI-124 TaxID=3377730 RepID=UPI003C79D2C8
MHVVEGYGLTEIKTITWNPLRQRKIGSIGVPSATTLLEVHDDLGFPLPPRQVGEIVYRPRVPHIMFSGYHHQPDATLETSAICGGTPETSATPTRTATSTSSTARRMLCGAAARTCPPRRSRPSCSLIPPCPRPPQSAWPPTSASRRSWPSSRSPTTPNST